MNEFSDELSIVSAVGLKIGAEKSILLKVEIELENLP